MGLLKGMNAVTQMLGLEEFEAVEVEFDPERKLRQIVVVPRLAVAVCPHCAQATDQRHQVRERRVRDLPMGEWNTELVVRCAQYECSRCHKLFTPRFGPLDPSAHATRRLLKRMGEMLRFGDVKNVAAFFGLPETTLQRWYYQDLQQPATSNAGSSSCDLQPIGCLGIDELSRKKTGSILLCADRSHQQACAGCAGKPRQAGVDRMADAWQTPGTVQSIAGGDL